jgi:hypothetical protein
MTELAPIREASYEYRAAAATLAALRAVLPNPEDAHPGRYEVLPRSPMLDQAGAIAALAAEPKPLLCTASAFGDLCIMLWPARHTGHRPVRDAEWLRRSEGVRLRFACGPEEAILSPAEFDQWLVDYRVIGCLSGFGHDGPREEPYDVRLRRVDYRRANGRTAMDQSAAT